MVATVDPAELDRTFHALADATRRDILVRVIDRERSVTALAAGYRMSLPAVQKHVAVLERAGLVRKTLVEMHGRRHWRTRNLGEGRVWPTPPHFHGELSVDWEGEVRCNPEIRTSGFNIGVLAVQVRLHKFFSTHL